MKRIEIFPLALFIALLTAPVILKAAVVTGELKKWHKVTLTFDGLSAAETDTPSPFLNYRLNVTFTQGLKSYKMPGYFAADGNAAETGATSGSKWRVHFSPDETGVWNYSVSMRMGTNIAVSTVTGAGSAVSPFDGETGTITIGASDKTGRDLRGKGLLQYVGEHYLRFAETNEYFVKGGADSPENMLAYEDFDNTPNTGGYRKTWSAHLRDTMPGDPAWRNGKGKGLIGAVNYLSGKGMNVFSFLTMNIAGDDKNVFPYVSTTEFTRMDCSKLDQWEIIFEHAVKMGMYLHFKTQETENELLLDSGDLGNNRRLYYRELIARFSHHPALNWNLGEESADQTNLQRIDMAQFFYDNDPYRHHVVLHTYPGQQNLVYTPLLGTNSKLTGVSIQINWNAVHGETIKWVDSSARRGKKWVVANDEQGDANTGVPPDPGWPGYTVGAVDQKSIRHQTLWGNLMAGGGGVEYYFGYSLPQTDLNCQDYRSRDRMWDYTRFALEFYRNNLPFWKMHHNDGLTSSTTDFCFALVDTLYTVYLPTGGTTNITLGGTTATQFTVTWFNPRTGLFEGGQTTLNGGASRSVGNPPNTAGEDWVVFVKLNGYVVGLDLQASPFLKRTDILNSEAGRYDMNGRKWPWRDSRFRHRASLRHLHRF